MKHAHKLFKLFPPIYKIKSWKHHSKCVGLNSLSTNTCPKEHVWNITITPRKQNEFHRKVSDNLVYNLVRGKKTMQKNTEQNHCRSPLMLPRSRSPMKKGRKRIKFHNEAQNPVGGSIHSDLIKTTLKTHFAFSFTIIALK